MNIEEYKRTTGAKRFRRTKEELSLGLSDEQALEKRLATNGGIVEAPKTNPCLEIDLPKVSAKRTRDGDIIIHIRPEKKVDSDYFERVPENPIEIILDNSWYSWFDTLADTPYNNDTNKLVKHILEKGIGEVLTKFRFQADIEEYERPVRTMEEVKQ